MNKIPSAREKPVGCRRHFHMQMPGYAQPWPHPAAPASLFRGDPSALILPANRGLSRQVPSPRLAHATAGILPSPRRSRSGRQPRIRYPYTHPRASLDTRLVPRCGRLGRFTPRPRARTPPNRTIARHPIGAYPNCRGTMSAALESLKVRFEMAAARRRRWRTLGKHFLTARDAGCRRAHHPRPQIP